MPVYIISYCTGSNIIIQFGGVTLNSAKNTKGLYMHTYTASFHFSTHTEFEEIGMQ